MLALVAVLVVLAGTLATLSGVLVARAKAQGAADLAALSAATVAQRQAFGADLAADPCVVADEVAARNGALVTSCRPERGAVVAVHVAVPTSVGAATAVARAGPRS